MWIVYKLMVVLGIACEGGQFPITPSLHLSHIHTCVCVNILVRLIFLQLFVLRLENGV